MIAHGMRGDLTFRAEAEDSSGGPTLPAKNLREEWGTQNRKSKSARLQGESAGTNSTPKARTQECPSAGIGMNLCH